MCVFMETDSPFSLSFFNHPSPLLDTLSLFRLFSFFARTLLFRRVGQGFFSRHRFHTRPLTSVVVLVPPFFLSDRVTSYDVFIFYLFPFSVVTLVCVVSLGSLWSFVSSSSSVPVSPSFLVKLYFYFDLLPRVRERRPEKRKKERVMCVRTSGERRGKREAGSEG